MQFPNFKGGSNELVFGTLDKLGPQLQEDIAAKITKELQSVFKTGAAFSSARVQYAVANMRAIGQQIPALSNDSEAYSKAKEYVETLHSLSWLKSSARQTIRRLRRLSKRPEPILSYLRRGDLRSSRDHQSAQRYHNGHA
jgi:hypothetical protein